MTETLSYKTDMFFIPRPYQLKLIDIVKDKIALIKSQYQSCSDLSLDELEELLSTSKRVVYVSDRNILLAFVVVDYDEYRKTIVKYICGDACYTQSMIDIVIDMARCNSKIHGYDITINSDSNSERLDILKQYGSSSDESDLGYKMNIKFHIVKEDKKRLNSLFYIFKKKTHFTYIPTEKYRSFENVYKHEYETMREQFTFCSDLTVDDFNTLMRESSNLIISCDDNLILTGFMFSKFERQKGFTEVLCICGYFDDNNAMYEELKEISWINSSCSEIKITIHCNDDHVNFFESKGFMKENIKGLYGMSECLSYTRERTKEKSVETLAYEVDRPLFPLWI